MSDRELLFRVTAKDFEETHVRGSGPGGQHRNKTSTGVRLRHRASGAVAEATEHKSQEQNRREAWKRVRDTPEWKVWFRDMVATTSGQPTIAQRVDRAMRPENITTQVLDDRQRWISVDPEELT
jgi:hypothetical protein